MRRSTVPVQVATPAGSVGVCETTDGELMFTCLCDMWESGIRHRHEYGQAYVFKTVIYTSFNYYKLSYFFKKQGPFEIKLISFIV